MKKRTPLTDAEVIGAIEANQGSIKLAADALGVTPQAVYKRLDDRGLVIEVTGVVVRKAEAA